MADAGRRIAGRVDYQIDGSLAEHRLDIVRNPGAAGAERGREIRRRVSLGGPADARQVPPRGLGVQIGDDGDMDAGRADRLGEKHRGELAAAEDPDADGIVVGLPLAEQPVKVHAAASADAGIGAVRQSSGSASMAAKSRWAIHSGRLKRRMWLSTWHSDR